MKTKITGIMLLLALWGIRASSQTLTIDTIAVTNASSCSACNGSAVANVIGGYPPYTFYWYGGGHHSYSSNVDSGLCAGTYVYLFVYDSHGDTAVNSGWSNYVVIGPQAPNIDDSTTGRSGCNNNMGWAQAQVSGGASPYTYYWVPGGQTTATATGLSAGVYTLTVTGANGCNNSSYFIVQSGSSLYSTINTSAATCANNNGSAADSVFGGNPPYTFTWSTGQTTSSISGLSAGTYTCTVTDAGGCNITDTCTVNGGLQVSASGTTVSCLNSTSGTASVTSVTGGVSPYTYLWSDANSQTTATATGLSAGSYTVDVTDNNGCTGLGFAYCSSQANNLWIDDNSSYTQGSTCSLNDGSATISVNGGATPYTYSWSPGGQTTQMASNLSAGVYTVMVTDANGCSIMDTMTVPHIGPVPYVTTTSPSCSNPYSGTAMVDSVSGGVSPYTYEWLPSTLTNPMITGLSAGSYSLIVTSQNGCSSTTTVNVYPPTPIYINAVSYPDSSNNSNCNYVAWIGVYGGTAPFTFSWSSNVNIVNQGTDTGYYAYQQADSLCIGSYTVCVTDANGCMTCDTIIVGPLGIATIKNNAGSLKIYPNPASDNLFVATDGIKSGAYTLSVYDMMGRMLKADNININQGETIPLNISAMPAGEYLLRISNATSNRTSPFVITR